MKFCPYCGERTHGRPCTNCAASREGIDQAPTEDVPPAGRRTPAADIYSPAVDTYEDPPFDAASRPEPNHRPAQDRSARRPGLVVAAVVAVLAIGVGSFVLASRWFAPDETGRSADGGTSAPGAADDAEAADAAPPAKVWRLPADVDSTRCTDQPDGDKFATRTEPGEDLNVSCVFQQQIYTEWKRSMDYDGVASFMITSKAPASYGKTSNVFCAQGENFSTCDWNVPGSSVSSVTSLLVIE